MRDIDKTRHIRRAGRVWEELQEETYRNRVHLILILSDRAIVYDKSHAVLFFSSLVHSMKKQDITVTIKRKGDSRFGSKHIHLIEPEVI